MKQIGRREFIKYSAGLAGLLVLGKYARSALALTGTEVLSTEEATERAVNGLGR